MPEGQFFLTTRRDHDPLIYKTPKITVTSDLSLVSSYLSTVKNSGFDTEFNNSKVYVGELLLLQYGDTKHRMVVDCTSDIFPEFVQEFNKYPDIMYVGHQIKGDYKQAKTNGLNINKMFDTMVAEQRLYLGIQDWGYGLVDLYTHYLNRYMPEDKSIGKEFTKMTKRSRFLLKHIMYAGADVPELVNIAKLQMAELRRRGQYEWFKENENGIIGILGDMEIEGIKLYEDKWVKLINQYKLDKLQTEQKLDEHLRGLGKKIKPRNRAPVTVLNLFGGSTEVENQNFRHINYNSPKQIIKVIKKELNLPVPILKEKGKVTESTKESALQQYLLEYPRSPLKKFINDLLYYKECEKFISSYGLKFLETEVKKKGQLEPGYKNKVTGKVHTLFKQCETETGRLASGYAKEGYFNCQNLPAKRHIRECFGLTEEEIADGWFLSTVDLSGAELIIMAALANDYHLYELGADKIINGVKVEGDLHSPLATKSWRSVYECRKLKFFKNYGEESWRTASIEKLNEYFTITDTNDKSYVLTQDFEVLKDKKHPNIQLRTDFKRMGFGTVYGLKPNKGSQTLNIPRDEAAGVIQVIENEIPLTIKMVKQAADYAVVDGYVEFNVVSHNRRFFKPVMDILDTINIPNPTFRYQYVQQKLDYKTFSDIEGAARNCRIQGSQADIIKEAMQKVMKRAADKKIEAKLIFSVHDELVVKHKGREFLSDIIGIMEETSNRYLEPYSSTIKMRCEGQILHNWTK